MDVYNPKVIQSSMGSFTRIQVVYKELTHFLSRTRIPVVGTKLTGKHLHSYSWPERVIISFGNESKGLSPELEQFMTEEVSIPKFGDAESLNVGIATAVVLDNVFRSCSNLSII